MGALPKAQAFDAEVMGVAPYVELGGARVVGGWQAAVEALGNKYAGEVCDSEGAAVESAMQIAASCILGRLFGALQ